MLHPFEQKIEKGTSDSPLLAFYVARTASDYTSLINFMHHHRHFPKLSTEVPLKLPENKIAIFCLCVDKSWTFLDDTMEYDTRAGIMYANFMPRQKREPEPCLLGIFIDNQYPSPQFKCHYLLPSKPIVPKPWIKMHVN
jgi:hypothetical protein